MDHKVLLFQKMRADLSLAVLPLQYVINTPIKMVGWLANSITSQHQLLDENARLRAHELLLESKLQKLLALERENAQLRELLRSSSRIGGRVIVGQLLAVDLELALQQVIINKGKRNAVYVGQPVLDAYGVFGQVLRVGPLTSRVMLITDPQSAVPVQNYRNGVRTIAVGQGIKGQLKLINVPETYDIKKGDLFVTSGLGLRYPVGYPVGVVKQREYKAGDRFVTLILEPLAHLNRTEQVLLAWPTQAKLVKAVQKQLKDYPVK